MLLHNRNSMTRAFLVATCTLLASGAVCAKEFTIKNGQSSGSSITSAFSFHEAGGDNKTNLSTFQGSDSLGDVYGQIVADYDTSGGCALGSAFFVFASQGVLSYKKGQLFLQASGSSSPNQGCLRFDNYPALQPASVELVIKYDIVGGSGEYEGATGELTSVSVGTLLYNDLSIGDVNQFGSFQSEYEGWFEIAD